MRSHQGLSQAESAVARGNFRLCEYLKGKFLKPLLQALRQESILECASAETNAIQVLTLANLLGKVSKRLHQSLMELCADCRNRHSTPQIFDEFLEHRLGVQDPAISIRIQVESITRTAVLGAGRQR